MGHFCHHAIAVAGFDAEALEALRGRVLAIENLILPVSGILQAPMNGSCSFFVGPDGSKEGWPESDLGDRQRGEVIALLEADPAAVNWAELRWGDEMQGPERILRTPRDPDADQDPLLASP